MAAQGNVSSTKYEVPSCNFNFSSKVKRPFDTYEDVDQENVDPATLVNSGKKAKGSDGAPVKPRQTTHFNLTTVNKSVIKESSKIARSTLGVKPRIEQSSTTLDNTGDANKIKYAGIAARSRLAGKRIVRVGPYVAGGHVPLSTGASPSLLVEGSIPKPRLGKKSRKGWDFQIHEDTPIDESAILMEHSAYTLDISDDENRGKFRDDCDKENIPPPGCPTSAVRPVSRRDVMTDEVRSPLGKLNAADYYAPGCDAASVINAPQEELPSPEPVSVEFGSIDGKLHDDAEAKLNNVTSELINHIEGSLAGNAKEAACNKSNIA